jgi:hypothetical protein
MTKGLDGAATIQEIVGTTTPTKSDLLGAEKRVVQSNSPARQRALRMQPEEVIEAKEMAWAGDDTELLPYQPTSSINPPRPRTRAAGYDPASQTLMVRFRDGTRNNPRASWNYYNVPPRVWSAFQRVKSPGRYINTMMDTYQNGPGDF